MLQRQMLKLLCSIEKYILQYLGSGFNASMVDCYIDCNFTSQGKSLGVMHVATNEY